MRFRTANRRRSKALRRQQWQRAFEHWLGDAWHIARPDFRLIHSSRIGGKMRLLGDWLAVETHADHPPRFVTWDEAGSITQEQIDFFRASRPD